MILFRGSAALAGSQCRRQVRWPWRAGPRHGRPSLVAAPHCRRWSIPPRWRFASDLAFPVKGGLVAQGGSWGVGSGMGGTSCAAEGFLFSAVGRLSRKGPGGCPACAGPAEERLGSYSLRAGGGVSGSAAPARPPRPPPARPHGLPLPCPALGRSRAPQARPVATRPPAGSRAWLLVEEDRRLSWLPGL